MLKELGIFAVIVALLGLYMATGLMLLTPVQAQQKPYQGYKVYGGCLYITPQGYAVLDPGYQTKAECQ